MVLLLASCQPGGNSDDPSELTNKTVYSILQSYEYKWRNRSNDSGCIVVISALNSDYHIVGIPLSNASKGYSWMVLNPQNPNLESEYLRVPSDQPVLLSQADVGYISRKTKLSHVAINVLTKISKSDMPSTNSSSLNESEMGPNEKGGSGSLSDRP